MLATLETLAEGYPISDNTSALQITKETFSIAIVHLGDNQSEFAGLNFSSPFDSESHLFGSANSTGDVNSRTSIYLPPTLFDNVDTDSARRVIFSAFSSEALFLRRAGSGRVSSPIVSAQISGDVRVKNLQDPIQLVFYTDTEMVSSICSTAVSKLVAVMGDGGL